VSSFFRNPAALDDLVRLVVPLLAPERNDAAPFRAWVPRCSTGEEAYSLAIVLAEQRAAAQAVRRVQIFATDSDPRALAVARRGIYPERIAGDVSAERLHRFFRHGDHQYTITVSIRDSIVFGVQDLQRDPPFSRLDVISGRTVQMEPDTRERWLQLFHVALNPGGYLFLGTPHGADRFDELFAPVSHPYGIYRRIASSTRSRPAWLAAALSPTTVGQPVSREAPEGSVAAVPDQRVLDHVAPASLVVRSGGHIVGMYGALERYIQLPTDDAPWDAVALARDAIKPALRQMLDDAAQDRQVVQTLDISLEDGRSSLRLTVIPLNQPHMAERLWLMLFEDLAEPPRALSRPAADPREHRIRHLEFELRAAKEHLQPLLGRLERRDDELKAAREAVLSMEEELQSANEELTTSREELQTMNEELMTLNTQLQDKVSELTAVNGDLANLLGNAEIATVFLDADLRIKRFTAAASHVLNLRSSDIGRPIHHIASTLEGVDLAVTARAVLDRRTSIEQDATGRNGRQFIARTLPYRTDELGVQGVVVTLVDVTTLKRSERELTSAREQVADDLRRMTCLHALSVELLTPGDMTALLHEILRSALEITGADMGDIKIAQDDGTLTIAAQSGLASPFLEYFARVDARGGSVSAAALRSRQRTIVDDVEASPALAGSAALPVLRAAGVRAMQSTPLWARSGTLLGMLSTHYRASHAFNPNEERWLDLLAARTASLIERARLERDLLQATHTLEQAVAERTRSLQLALDGAKAGTFRIDLRAHQVVWGERARAMLGVADPGPRPFDGTFPEVHVEDRARLIAQLNELAAGRVDRWDVEFRVPHRDGTVATLRGIGQAERDGAGQLLAVVGINLDVSGAKAAEAALRATRASQQETSRTMEELLAAAAEGVLTTTSAGTIERTNTALDAMFGYFPGELAGQPLARLIPDAARAAHATHQEAFWAAPRSRSMGRGLDLAARRKDGSSFPIEVSLAYVETAAGGRALAFVTDISQRKRAEDDLRRSHAALQAHADSLRHRTEQLRRLASDLTLTEQQTREQLAKRVHDDLQQILFSAKLRIDRLVGTKKHTPIDRTALAKARSEIEQAIAAARSLSVELFPPQLHDGSLSVAIRWLATWMGERYGLTVDVTADPRATLDEKDLRILAFESVRELLFDVVKHARVDRAAVDLSLTAQDHMQISVVDAGIGFDPATVLDPTARPIGWGLFSIRERAELLGGRLDVQSAPGHGTRFALVIPRGESRRPATLRPLRILIADDHAVARAGLREILTERREFDIVGEASTGAEAVALAKTVMPDAIIIDVAMPELDGVEATRQIHAAQPGVQIFGVSTQERPDGLHAIEAAGAVGFFAKGDDAQHIIERLLSLRMKERVSPESATPQVGGAVSARIHGPADEAR
jgi:PAS domain S-box-containing protein